MDVQNTEKPGWEKLKLALIGQAGSGKTTSLLTLLTAGRKPFVIDAEGGMLALAGHDVPFISVKSWNPYSYTLEGEEGSQKRIYPDDDVLGAMRWLLIEENSKPYDTIVLDTGTKMQNFLEKAAGRKHIDDSYAKWADVKEYSERLINSLFYTLPHDIIIICTATLVEDKLRGATIIRPNFKGQFANDFPHMPDELYFAERTDVDGTVSYVWHTVPGTRLECKSRIRGLTDLIPDVIPADFGFLYGVIKERFTTQKKG